MPQRVRRSEFTFSAQEVKDLLVAEAFRGSDRPSGGRVAVRCGRADAPQAHTKLADVYIVTWEEREDGEEPEEESE